MLIPRPETGILLDAFERLVADRRGTTLFIAGEPGVGKSTFVENFLEECDARSETNTLTATGRCIDLDGISRGYLPWKEILIELDADKAAGKDPEKKKSFKTIVKTLFDESGSEWIQNIPHIGDISAAIIATAHAVQRVAEIDVYTGESRELSFKERLRHIARECTGAWMGAIPIVGGLAEAIFTTSRKLAESRRDIQMKNQEDFFILVMSRLRDLAKENPVVIFLDDLQWADASSLSLLLYLSKNLHDAPYPLLIIGSYRPEDIQRGRYNTTRGDVDRHPLEEKINIMDRYAACSHVTLETFDATQIDRYISQRFPNNSFDSRVVARLLHVTGGNALFVQETLTNMVERNIIHREGESWTMTKDPDYSLLPKTIEGVIKERYERLSDELRELLEIAAIDGEEFAFEILEIVMGENTLKLSRGIDSLIGKHALVHKSNKVYDQLTRIYEFTHNLVQKYIYYSLSPDFRRDVHRMIAGAIQTLVDEDDMRLIASEYSFHLGLGEGIIDEERQLLLDTSNLARAGARRTGIERYLSALKKSAIQHRAEFNNAEAMRAFDHVIELAKILEDEQTIVAFTMEKGSLCLLVGDWSGAHELFSTVVDRALSTGDRRSELQARCERGILEWKRGLGTEAMSDVEESLAISREIDDRSGISHALSALGTMFLERGEHANALDRFQQALSIAEELHDLPSVASITSSIGDVYFEWGELDKANEFFLRQRAICDGLGHRSGMVTALERLGNIAMHRGEYDTALDYFFRALDQCEKQGNRGSTALLLGRIGGVHLERAEFDRAAEYFERKLTISRELGAVSGIASTIGNMGIIHGARRDFDRALDCYREVLEMYERVGDRRGVSIAIGNMGLIYSRQGTFEQAMECHVRDMEICTKLNDRHGISNASASIGSIHRARGEFDKALECYRQQLEICMEMGDKRGIADANSDLGLVFLEKGEYEMGLEYLLRGIELQRSLGMFLKVIRDETGLVRALLELATARTDMPNVIQQLLPNVSSRTWAVDTLREANRRVTEVIELCTDVKEEGDHYRLRARILHARIAHELGLAGAGTEEERRSSEADPDPVPVQVRLRGMLEDIGDDVEEADLCFWIWRYDDKRAEGTEGGRALELYQKLFARAPRHVYRERIEELRSSVPDTRAG